nr:hypothetical protein [Bradyrhizobium cenepequi]
MKLGFDVHNCPERSVDHQLSQFFHRGLESSFMPDAEADARSATRIHRPPNLVHGKPDRLLAKHVLARACHHFDLSGVLRMRRGGSPSR